MLTEDDILSMNDNITDVDISIPEHEIFDIKTNQYEYIPKTPEEFEDDDEYYVRIWFRFKYEDSDKIHTNGRQPFDGKTEKDVLSKIENFLKEHKVKEYRILVF
jgi:hypothetical protein